MTTPSSITDRLKIYESPQQGKLLAWVQMARTFLVIQKRVVSVLVAEEVTLPQFDVLATLRFCEGVTQQELAQRLLVTKGNVCGVLDRLEGLGFVERQPHPEDRRANRLFLTEQGHARVDALLPLHDAVVAEAFSVLQESETVSLRGLLERLEQVSGTED